jgi:hypothetical protein
MVRGCVSTELEDPSLLRPAEGVGTVGLALLRTADCEAPDPLPAGFANDAGNTSDSGMVTTARNSLLRNSLLMTFALRPTLGAIRGNTSVPQRAHSAHRSLSESWQNHRLFIKPRDRLLQSAPADLSLGPSLAPESGRTRKCWGGQLLSKIGFVLPKHSLL